MSSFYHKVSQRSTKERYFQIFTASNLSQNNGSSISQRVLNFRNRIGKFHHFTNFVFAGIRKDFGVDKLHS